MTTAFFVCWTTSTAIIGMAAKKATANQTLMWYHYSNQHIPRVVSKTVRRKGASQEEISSIPVFRISKEEAEANERCFCLEDYQHDEECRRLPCGHFYHKHVSWRERERKKRDCRVVVASSHPLFFSFVDCSVSTSG